MSIFKKSDWTPAGSNEASLSVGKGKVGLSLSTGEFFFNDPHGAKFKFNFGTAGVQVSLPDVLPIGFDINLAEMPDRGMVFVNSKWRTSLSESDFKGAFLVYQGKGISLFGPGVSGTIIFFDIGMGLYTSYVTTASTFGFGAAAAPAEVIASCSSVYVSVGTVFGTAGASLSGSLGIVHSVEKQQSDVVGVWRVATNGMTYKYAFYDNGSCTWWKDTNMLTPDGAGRWKTVGDYLEINWDSGSVEQWDLPISESGQKGRWTDPRGNVAGITANKTDIINIFMQNERVGNRLSTGLSG